MIVNLASVLTELFSFQTDRFLSVLLGILACLFIFGATSLLPTHRRKLLLWLPILLIMVAVGLTIGLYGWRLPHGLSGRYYDNPSWQGDPVREMRYFAQPGQRVDRFLDFAPNDFNHRYPFSRSKEPFSIQWQGYVRLPDDGYHLDVRSNFGTWLYIDDTLIDGSHAVDLGTADAQAMLEEGWSYPEHWTRGTSFDFVWSAARRSVFSLGVDEVADYQLLMRCMPFVYPGSPPQQLTVSLNDTPLQTLTLQEGWQTYRIPVPQSVLKQMAPGMFRVNFSYAHVARPSEVLPPSQDQRRLAVAFDWVALRKASADRAATFAFQAPTFSRGMHRIRLNAQHTGNNPFLQLRWRPSEDSPFSVVPEDWLLPADVTFEHLGTRMLLERLLLGLSIVSKCGLILLVGGLLIVYVLLPSLKHVLTVDALLIGGICLVAFGIRLAFLWERAGMEPAFYNL
ncbi:hypothetical protein GF339_02160, partial [candidate division KSB3 bacterium]|nr:hypothetical protein [candidate division KSB3 bacterium]MBD3323356.1 hypothetical protein [candidate division KSB3 bacterium]